MTHALASTTLTKRPHVSQVFRVTSHIVGFRSCTSCRPFNCRCTHLLKFRLVRAFLAEIHTTKTRLLRCSLYVQRVRCSRTADSCKRFNYNIMENNYFKFVKVVRLRFSPKTEHNGSLSIFSLCMHPHLSTSFESSWTPPRTTDDDAVADTSRMVWAWVVVLQILDVNDSM